MAEAKEKGDIVEDVVAWLHEVPGVLVQQNARLPTLGSQRRTREIDVLLTSYVAGHPVRLAVECKNEARRIGSPRIDAFRGKLEAVGIPPSLGIYVSASGYTQGALETARTAGIQTLQFEGLSSDRLSLDVDKALQSVVVLLPDVTAFNLVGGHEEPTAEVGEALLFYDGKGQPAGTVQDFVWQAWQTGELAPQVGRTYLTLNIPADWHNVIAGQRSEIQAIGVTVDILALVLTFEGEARFSALVDPKSREVDHHGATVAFGRPLGRYDLKGFREETELEQYLTSKGLVHVVHRMRSPRIRFWNMMFWPPSQRVADIVAERMAAFDEGRIPDPRPFSFEQLEGSDLSAAWEPIAAEYMAGLNGRAEGKTWQTL